MSRNFVGGIWKRGMESRQRGLPPAEIVGEDWGWMGPRSELFLRGASTCARVFLWDSLALLIRGYARIRGSSGSLELERVAEEIRCQYVEHGTLAVDDLDGSFTVALLDGQAERVLLYRNLVGSGYTYYRATEQGFLFAGNLAELADLSADRPRTDEQVLPAYFLFRSVPGRQTLLAGYHRLLPGEQIRWDARGLKREQRHTFASLVGSPVREKEAVDQVESVMAEILADCNAHRPGSVNLLSGGVDSSYIQAAWNQTVHAGELMPPSYSISVDHPMTWLDTDYAITASQTLGTCHVLVPADSPYESYLLDTVAAAGEPLNHVQSAYFGHLARVMKADGVSAGLCGEGADSLFGLGLANQLHNAGVMRRMLPGSPLRAAASAVFDLLRCPRLAYTSRLANRMDDLGWAEHPVNRVAVFTDRATADACFGRDAVDAALAERRGLAALQGVSDNPFDQMHAAGFLGEAMDSAGLWATLFQRAGTDLLCPFLDSRMMRLALNLPPSLRYPFRKPKYLLRQALSRRGGANLAYRAKLGFGQPIFEWLGPGGQLRQRVEEIPAYPFLRPGVLDRAKQRPTWFLYSLLVYDVWHRLFVERSLPRPQAAATRAVPAVSMR